MEIVVEYLRVAVYLAGKGSCLELPALDVVGQALETFVDRVREAREELEEDIRRDGVDERVT